MAIQFRKATKEQSRLRLSIQGPAKSGKTYTSLKVATEMNLGKIAVIDTERGSAAKYSKEFEFDVFELNDFHPEKYIEAIHAAEKAGYDILIIDSTTHEWNGKNGILELHETAIQRQRTKNSFTAWAEVTPLHMRFIDAILGSKCHIIASVRSKTEYVQDKDSQGQTQIRKVGMAAIQRAEMEYEYDIMIEMDVNHVGVIAGTRCVELDSKTFKKPGRELAEILVAWLSDGAEPAVVKQAEPEPQPEPSPVAPVADAEREKLVEKIRAVFADQGKAGEWFAYQAKHVAGKDADTLADLLRRLEGAASKHLIEEIEGPLFKALGAVGVDGKEALDKITQIADGECGLETMSYTTLVSVRDGLNAWLGQLKQEMAAKAA